MNSLDQEEELDDDVSDNSSAEDESIVKRKRPQNYVQPLKKVKYEDIASKTAKKQKSELYRPPTVEELNELKETQNLYNNNLIRLQIEELVKEIRIKNKHRDVFDKWLESFKLLVEKLPQYEVTLSDLTKKEKKKQTERDKCLSFISNATVKCDQDVSLKLTAPASIEVFGLDKINALPGPNLNVSVNLKMPRACFNVKDYLNNRYFVKRYYYLAYINYFLIKNGMESEWLLHNDNKLLPILKIKVSEKVAVRIYATPIEDYFKPLRGSSSINNVRVNVFGSGDLSSEEPTLFYNASLAHDITLTMNNVFVEGILGELPNVQEAIKLIYVWLIQRELMSFTELILYVITYLVMKKRVNKHMSSYQVVRNFWNFIAEIDLTKNLISISDDSKPDILESFQRSFEVVILDRSGYYNVAAFLTDDAFKKIKSECDLAFKLLDDGGINSFNSLFMRKLPVELQYDVILRIKSPVFESIDNNMSENDRAKYIGHPELYALKHLKEMLRKGLNKRASIIVPMSEENKLYFGIDLDISQAFNILEKGPALNDPLEKDFRAFWGKLSSDRRFKDGSVSVAVHFETNTVKDRREIIKTIIDWVVSKKLKLEYELYFNDFEDLLVNKKIAAHYPLGTNEEACLRAINASDELGKKLRALELPLAITSVQGISDTFNLTEVFPPISTNFRSGNKLTSATGRNLIINEKRVGMVPRYVKPMECVLQLEHSAKWPKNLEAIKHMKTAFFLEVSKALQKKHKIVSAVKPELLEVVYEGYVFRYRIYLAREIGYLKKETTNNGVVAYKDTPQSREMEMRFEILPKLMGALKGVQAQNPTFGPATALTKRWLRSQLIDDHYFPDNVINLLSASLYLNQSGFKTPATPQIGFLRFLKFFSELQWHIQAVVVNFNDDISKEALAEVDSRLLQNRETCPNLFIATPFDNCQSVFTRSAPSKEILRRVRQLATETLLWYSKIVKGESSVTVKELFLPNLDGYDVVIHLKPLLNPHRHEQVIADELEGKVALKPYNMEESTHIPIVGFNPVQCYLDELRRNYGEFAHFFHDSYGGNVIGVLWIPKSVEEKEFKVPSANGRRLVDGRLVPNLDCLIEDFYILGRDIIKVIDTK